MAWITLNSGSWKLTAFEVGGLKGEVVKVKEQVASVQSNVNELAMQVEQLYASQITEVFDRRHQDRVRFVATKYGEETGYHVEITLKFKPIVGSLQITRKALTVAPIYIRLNGKTISFPTLPGYFEDDLGDAIVVVYHPRPTATVAGKEK